MMADLKLLAVRVQFVVFRVGVAVRMVMVRTKHLTMTTSFLFVDTKKDWEVDESAGCISRDVVCKCWIANTCPRDHHEDLTSYFLVPFYPHCFSQN